MVLAAVVLVLGLSQCKKQEQQTTTDTNGTVAITLDVKTHDGSRIDVNPNNGMVAFEYGDLVYVASGGKFVGTLTNNGNTFAGNITNPTEGEPLYFFFLGNKTPEEALTPGSSTSCSVNISDQTSGYPVISFATSNETFTGAGLYTAFFLNKAALVKFDVTTISPTPTCVLGLNNKVTVDFSTNGFAYSQVENGIVKLSGRSGERWAILLPQSALAEGDEGSVYTEDGNYTGIRPAIPAITANDYLNEGIVLTATADMNPGITPTGAISGKFTINDNGDRVCFSQGNLQYQASTNTWRFAESQWNYMGDGNSNVSETYDGWIDLLGWGTSGYNHGAVCYQPWSTSTNSNDYLAYGEANYNLYDQNGKADWGYNAISNGGNTEGQWRTLTLDELYYLFYERPTLSGILYAQGIVNGIGGVILLPNTWDASTYELNNPNGGNYGSNTITATDWTSILEANGAVFLPAAGFRVGTSLNGVGTYGCYWSSSYNNSYRACGVYFDSGELYPYLTNRYGGCSVRLVRNAQ
jgi:hypothetical protein